MGMPCEGAHFELTIDGTPRSYRDDPQIALEAARYLKVCNPKSNVALRDIRTNVSTPVEWEADVLLNDRPTSESGHRRVGSGPALAYQSPGRLAGTRRDRS